MRSDSFGRSAARTETDLGTENVRSNPGTVGLAAPECDAVRGGAGEDVAELLRNDVTVEAEEVGAPAHPPAGRLAAADVVILGASGDGVEVVAPAARSELGQRQHHDLPGRG
jgi:hypothetical protein